jgi:hypothetical protein
MAIWGIQVRRQNMQKLPRFTLKSSAQNKIALNLSYIAAILAAFLNFVMEK